MSGPIPDKLGNLANLRELHLHDNRLSGPIPDKLGNLANLRELYLYSNFTLSGPLPRSFTGLTSLTTLWLDGTELCTPADDEFQTWLRGVENKSFVFNCARLEH